jgi:hypothetical protein
MRSLLAQPNLLADAARTIALYRPRVGFQQHRSFQKDTYVNRGGRTRTCRKGTALLFDCQGATGGSSLVFNGSDER